MTYLSEPTAPNEGPVKEMVTINLPSGSFYRYRMMFFREHRSQGAWRLTRMQLTAVLPIILLTTLEFITDEGVFCQGPADPWNYADGVASLSPHAIYWIPCAVYTRVSLSAHQVLRAQVSTCSCCAFSTSKYTVRFLVYQLIEFHVAAFKF